MNLAQKENAIRLRKKGKSIRDIETILDIPRSTLSGWLRNVKLSERHKQQLHKKWLSALVKARIKASKINKRNRLCRMKKIEEEVEKDFSDITINKTLGELTFAIFYLGEGTKTPGRVEISSTNTNILTAFLKLFRYLYSPNESRLRCRLNLRQDQSENQFKNYWSEILKIPKSQFIKTQSDKRAIRPSFKNYKGVCTIYYSDTNLQKRVMSIGEKFLKKVNHYHLGG